MPSGDDNARELQRRDEKLFDLKKNLDGLNQELAYNFYPERADFTTERALGAEFAIDIFDSAPLLARRDLGNARAAMLRPRGQQWFRAALPDDDLNERPDIARKLDQVNKSARALMYQAATGFVRAEKEADHDTVTFGNAVKTIESVLTKSGKRKLLERCWHLRDCAWLDDEDGVGQDFITRRFKASARHIVQQTKPGKRFEGATLAQQITDAIDKDPDKEFKLCHVMMRADEYEYYKKPSAPKADWVSVYYDSEHKMLLGEHPSQRFRYIIDRWATVSGSQYGISPAAITSLSDARGMQMMARVLLEAGEKALDPPLVAVQNKIKGDINQGAGSVTWTDQDYDERFGPAVRPLLPGDINPAIGIELIERVTNALKDEWYLTKLTLPQTAKTAYETAQLVEEFIRSNIPLFEPWEAGTELTLSEIFAVLIADGTFGPPQSWPKELADAIRAGELGFMFSNPLQDAIERNKVNQAQTVIGLIAGVSEINPQGPGSTRIDIEEMIEDATRGTGAPADWIKSDEMIAADQQRQAAQQQAAQMQGDVLGALHGAGQAAEVVNSGLDAAAKLRDLTQPAADQSVAYGPG